MGTTVVIQIGNSDNKLTQMEWSTFVEGLHFVVHKSFSSTHFFGGAPSDSPHQNWCAVGEIEDDLWQSNKWDSLEEWLDNIVRPYLSDLTLRFRQDSIAMTVGETEFVKARGGAKL